MNSNIKIYKDCDIVRNRNMFVDSITDYLNSLSNTISLSSVQYIKQGFHISVKLPLSEYQLELVKQFNYNYMTIGNNSSSTARTCHYFITKKIWRSENVAEFELELDTIQTFHVSMSSLLTDKSKINRCHKDRYVYNSISQKWRRKIDMYSEGFSPVLFNKFKAKYNESLNINWYLVYANQNDPSESLVNPVDVMIMPEEDMIEVQPSYCMQTAMAEYTTIMNYIDGTGNVLAIDGRGNISCEVTVSPTLGEPLPAPTTFTLTANQVLVIYATGTINVAIYNRNDVVWGHEVRIESWSYFAQPYFEFKYLNGIQLVHTDMNNISLDKILTASGAPNIITSDYTYMYGISHLDRTNAKLIKVIELPYSPIEVSQNTSVGENVLYHVDPAKFKFINTFGIWILALRNVGLKLKRNINFTLAQGLRPYNILQEMTSPYVANASKNAMYESKLYHSDYYLPKYVYDSFVFEVKCELISTPPASDTTTDSIVYVCSNTINSRFMFEFLYYNCDQLEEKDFNKVMTIARNNELPIFNQQYINYLRAGYNFDVKNKIRQNVVNYSLAGIQLVGAIASFVSSGVTGAAGVAGGVSLATSSIATFTHAINTTISNERSMEAKQEQLKMQSTNVYGSDDVDLMNEYAGNRLQMRIYEVSDKMRKALFDLFYYTGYIGDFLDNPVNYQNSRQYFNFVSADIVFKMTPNLPNDIVEDYVARYKEGITFFHRVNSSYNFAQDKENWETSLIPVVE